MKHLFKQKEDQIVGDMIRHIPLSRMTHYSYMLRIAHAMATPENLYSLAPSMTADCRRAPILVETTDEDGVMLTTQGTIYTKLLQPGSRNKGETPVLLSLGF